MADDAPTTPEDVRADVTRRAYWTGQGATPSPWSQVNPRSRAAWRAAARAAGTVVIAEETDRG